MEWSSTKASTNDSDLKLLDQWRQGSAAAGESLFGRYFDSLYRFFCNKCHGEVDDLVQSTFLACLRSRDQFRGKSSFRTYLYTIARHELYRHLRKSKKYTRDMNFNVSSIAEIVTPASAKIEKSRSARLMQKVLGELSVNQQLLIELYYWHELDAGTLAEIFEVSRETIRSRLFRIRQTLRAKLCAMSEKKLAVESEAEMMRGLGIRLPDENDLDSPRFASRRFSHQIDSELRR